VKDLTAMNEIMIGHLSDFSDQDHRILAVGELEVGIFRRGTKLYAYENSCPHYGGPVCQGKIFNRVLETLAPDQTSTGLKFSSEEHIVCPWHGYEYSLVTGSHPGDAALRLTALDVRLDDDRVYLRVPG
jgi:nitrite reductase/ring-hydroxylating ferredoxin subunit